MKPLLFILLFLSSTILLASPKIDKDHCTITLDNGKTFPLYGKVQIVEGLEDISVEVVRGLADIKIEKVSGLASGCGQWEFVTGLADIKVKFVTGLADIKVEFVNGLPGIP